MAPIIERITDIPTLTLGEGPHWQEVTESVYFVDVFDHSINRYVPSTGQYNKAQLEKQVNIIIPVKGKENQFICSTVADIVIVTWDGKSEKVSKIEKVAGLPEGSKDMFNDGKCDTRGRLWVGSIDPRSIGLVPEVQSDFTGILISIENGKATTHVKDVACSNGLGWNKEENKFYYVDTVKKTISAFDFDVEKGTLSNRSELFTPSKHGFKGLPDGMTVDVDGNLWVAIFGGSSVLKIDGNKPETLLQTIEIPGKQVTCAAWGGKNLDELYVTTALFSIEGTELLPPNNGATYRVTNLGTRGFAPQEYVL